MRRFIRMGIKPCRAISSYRIDIGKFSLYNDLESERASVEQHFYLALFNAEQEEHSYIIL